MLARLDDRRFAFELGRRGITARELAEAAGLTEQALSRVRHKLRITPTMLRRLAVALEQFPVLPELEVLLTEPVDSVRGRTGAPAS